MNMRQKGSSTLLFLAIFFSILGLSTGGLEIIKQGFNDVLQSQSQDDGIVETKNLEDEEAEFEEAEFPSPKEEVVFFDNKKDDVATKINSFENGEVQEELEKSDIEKTVTTPPPLVVENKYSLGDKEVLSNGGIILFTNAEREKNGLDTLKQNDLLMQAAQAKLNHMFDKQYFEHVAPTNGEDVSYWVDKFAYEYITVGENLALGNFKNSEDMVIAWMESPGHRANILKEGYEEIGVAVGYGEFDGSEVWLGVQIFATPLSACPAVDEILKIQIDMYETLTKETETILNSMQLTISLTQPETQAEYEEYNSLVAQYNELVVSHNGAVENLRSAINIYNDRVKAFNFCIATK